MTEDQQPFDHKQIELQAIVDCRNKLSKMLKKEGFLGEGSHLTVSCLGLLFIEACQGNPLMISLNMAQLMNIYESLVTLSAELAPTPETDPKKLN